MREWLKVTAITAIVIGALIEGWSVLPLHYVTTWRCDILIAQGYPFEQALGMALIQVSVGELVAVLGTSALLAALACLLQRRE